LVLLADITVSSARNPCTSQTCFFQTSKQLNATPNPKTNHWDGCPDQGKFIVNKLKIRNSQNSKHKISSSNIVPIIIIVKFVKIIILMNPSWPCIRPCRYRELYGVTVYIGGPLREVRYTVYCKWSLSPRVLQCKVTVYIDRFLKRVQYRVYCQCFVLVESGRIICELQRYVMILILHMYKIIPVFRCLTKFLYYVKPSKKWRMVLPFYIFIQFGFLRDFCNFRIILIIDIYIFAYRYLYIFSFQLYVNFSIFRYNPMPTILIVSQLGHFQLFKNFCFEGLFTVLVLGDTLTTNFRRCCFKLVYWCLVATPQGCSGGQRVLLSVDSNMVSWIFNPFTHSNMVSWIFNPLKWQEI